MMDSMYRPLRAAAVVTLATACTMALGQGNISQGDQGGAAAGNGAQPGVHTDAQPAQVNSVPDAQVEANVLRGLAGAQDLSNQPVTTNTVYGVVTLTGSVQSEQQRTEAENIVARTAGVKKVVDELTLGGQTTVAQAQGQGSQLPAAQPETAQQPNQDQAPGPDSDNTGQPQGPPAQANQPYPAPQNQQPYPQGQTYPQQGYPQAYPQQAPQQPYPQQPPQSYPQQPPQQGATPYGQPSYPQQPAYSQPRPGYTPPSQPGYAAGQPYGGQQAGQSVTIPSGALLRIRINQTLDSAHTQPGTTFDGVVVNDVVADGAIAIPRGATVQGTVVDAKKSGVLTGRGELSLQLTQVVLGGTTYPIASDVWGRNGRDKTTQTVNSTAIGGGVGAALGAIAGGGAGAAVGAGIGGALGLGSSAASPSGQIYVPAEGMLTFHLAQPVTVATLSQAEMDRLSQGVPATAAQRPGLVPRRVYAAPYPYPYPYYYRPYYYPYRY